MAVIKRNSYRLQSLVAVPGYKDENGNEHAGSAEWKGSMPCDDVPRGKEEEREFEDGVVRSYSYTVCLPSNCQTFAIGDRVKISLLGGIEREFEVKGYHRYQLQCKIWV